MIEVIKEFISLDQFSLIEACLSNGLFEYDEIENYYRYPPYSFEKFNRKLVFEGGNLEDKEKFLLEIDSLKNDSLALFELGGISEEKHLSDLEEIEDIKSNFDLIGEVQENVIQWLVIDNTFYNYLKVLGATVIGNNYGYWYGKSNTFHISQDPYLLKVAEILKKEHYKN
jgi:hypothetical protein